MSLRKPTQNILRIAITIPLRQMKATNIRVVGSIFVDPESEYGALRVYVAQKRALETQQQYFWFDWPKMISRYRSHSMMEKSLPGFTAYVVSYDYGNARQGLTRRDSLRILNRLNLRPPTAVETFRVSAADIGIKKHVEIINNNDSRRISCPTPINPEFPEFYNLSRNGGAGGFNRAVHRTLDNSEPIQNKDLYFFEHTDGCVVTHYECHFPLLIGIERSSE